MKWPTKKPTSSPSPSSSSPNAFPVSWVSKFKHRSESPSKESSHTLRLSKNKSHLVVEDEHDRQKPCQISQKRKSMYIGTRSQEHQKPIGGTCKVKAIESIKRKKKKKGKKMESFAVVKHSRDPGRDFRDSMMEMIAERRIERPAEMEELLACYLTLNEDEHHDLIIRVFQQVWRELDDTRALNRELEELNMASNG